MMFASMVKDNKNAVFGDKNIVILDYDINKKLLSAITVGKDVFEKIFKENIDPAAYVEEHGLKSMNDEGALRKTIEEIVANNPKSVEDYRNGKEKAIGFLVGQTMKEMKGKANPGMVNQLLKELL